MRVDFVHHSGEFLQLDGVSNIGYYEAHATSHDALDRDTAVQREVRHAAKALVAAVALSRARRLRDLDTESDPRPK